MPVSASLAETGIKLAVWNSELERRGPGLLLRDIVGGKDPQTEAALRLLTDLDADVILLAGFDYDHGLLAARRFAARLAAMGPDYPYLFALRPNRGFATGLDLDLDGRLGGPGDAQGWGYFSGQSGMVILSKLPVETEAVRDFSGLLWADLPGALWPQSLPSDARAVLRLSTTGHWEVPLILPDGRRLRLLVWHGSAPVFGATGEVNARRNHDETAFWAALIEGRLPWPAPAPPFAILGISNLDPVDGDGRHDAIRSLIAHPALQDPEPRAGFTPEEPGHLGDPALDTAAFAATGGLRTAVILPDASQTVAGAGILRPAPGDPLAETAKAASRSFPLWVRLALPAPP
ncbi:endonuclease/exonuclease/phosphatase family protein [Pseudogemmobacter bohemicus]|uniref:endonuclease/exonuclease/phosphatase family protein n=1 Tax=Pseudogemmobacter bohemicus TaxID=2250708 RepID=UPI000DD47823|nr:endonuclease/exonuclease/phosphatase family protein [Pseudogemmobacter bohemicus]